jgi:hypothetical protein
MKWLLVALGLCAVQATAFGQSAPAKFPGLQLKANDLMPVCAVGQLCLKYNAGTARLEQSISGGAYSALEPTLPNVGPGAGTYTLATGDSLTLDAQGRTAGLSTVTRTLTAGVGIIGGGTLAADRSFAVDQSFSPTWSGVHLFNAGSLQVRNGSNTFGTTLASLATASRVVMFPDASFTVVGRTTTDTLTNKSIDGLANTLTNIGNSSLANSSVIVNGTAGHITVAGSPVSLGGALTLSLANAGPGAGTIGSGTSYLTSLTLDAQGRVTAAASVSQPAAVTLYYQAVKDSTNTLFPQRPTLKFSSGFLVNDIAPDTVISPSNFTISSGPGILGGSTITLGGSLTLSVDQSFSPTWTGVHTFGNYQDNTVIAAPANPATGNVRFFAASRASGMDTLAYQTNAGNQVVIGRDLLVGVRNITSSTLTKGTVVYISGSTSGLPRIDRAQADASLSKLPALGVLPQDIPNNTNGFVLTRGVITNFNTSGWSAGDTLYVDPATPGGITNVEPAHPLAVQAIGTVEFVNNTTGSIMVDLVPITLNAMDGINGTSFSIGNGSGSTARSLLFKNNNIGTLTWNPTAARTLTLPDATGTLVAGSGSLTSGVIPVATGTSSLGNSSFTSVSGALDLAAAGPMFLGTSVATAIALGKSGITTTVTGGLTQLTGAFSLTGNAQSQLTTTTGNLVLDASSNVSVGAATAGGVVLGRIGTLVLLPGGTLRATTAAAGAGAGVNMQFGPGNGGAANGAGSPAGAGGTTQVVGGQGGAGDASNAPAAGGTVTISSGVPGTVGGFGGGANSGGLTFNIPAPSGTGASGQYLFEFAGSASPGIAMSTTQLSIAENTIVYGTGSATTIQMLGAQRGTANQAGAALLMTPSGGGNSDGTAAGGVGGNGTWRASVGGNGSGAQNPGNGGLATFAGGPGGTGGSGNSNGGDALLDGGAAQGVSTAAGKARVGDTTASAVTIGRTAITTTINGTLAINGNTTHADTKTIVGSWNNTGTSQNVVLSLGNSTAAALNAQQYSPMLELAGTGYDYFNGISDPVKMAWQVRSVQSSGPPTSSMVLYASSNGSPYTETFSIGAGGILYLGAGGEYIAPIPSGSGSPVIELQIASGIYPAIDGYPGMGAGAPTHRFNDAWLIRSNAQNIGLGDVASVPFFQNGYTQATTAGYTTVSTQTRFGLYSLGGQSRFAKLPDMGAITVTPTGTAGSATRVYFAVAVDRNGYTTLAGTGQTTTGNGTLSATNYDALTWAAIPGAVWYDVYLSSVAAANLVGTVTTNSFANTGAARYTSPGNGLVQTPINVTVTPVGTTGATTYTYIIAAVDAQGHITATSTPATITNGNAVLSGTNYNSISWSPIGGAAYFLVWSGTTGTLLGDTSTLGPLVNNPVVAAGGLVRTGGNLVTLTVPSSSYNGGHGLRVGDTFTISPGEALFATGPYTVGAVTSASVLTTTPAGASLGTNGSSTLAQTVTLPGTVAQQYFFDYGYAARTIGSAPRNNTADVAVDGRVTVGSFVVSSAPTTALSPQTFTSVPNGSMSNGWTNFAGNHAVGYYKDATGRVHLVGMAGGGTLNTAVFSLPAGFQPNAQLQFPSVSYTGSVVSTCVINISPTGVVTQAGGSTGGNVWISFNGISFLAEQ